MSDRFGRYGNLFHDLNDERLFRRHEYRWVFGARHAALPMASEKKRLRTYSREQAAAFITQISGTFATSGVAGRMA